MQFCPIDGEEIKMAVNELDLALIVDTTSSMGSLIGSVKADFTHVIKELAEHGNVDVRIGIVEYRDHEPEDYSFAAKSHAFVPLSQARSIVNSLQARGGGDEPESVFDGVVAAGNDLVWRENARRIAILVGDAPPHGYHKGTYAGYDRWPGGCPCGKTMQSTAMVMEEEGITLHAVGLTVTVHEVFTELSNLTGGVFFAARDRLAVKEIKSLVEREFKDIVFDKDVLSLWDEGIRDKFDIAARLQCTIQDVLDSIGRMRSRNLIVSEECVST